MTPLEIIFYLRTPIALGSPFLMFDSLLMHIKLKEELGEKYYTLPTKIPISELPEPPLKKWKDLYVSSVAVIEGDMRVFSYVKRGDFPFPKGKIERGRGFFKDFYLKVVYIPTKTVRFYATGEKEEIERLASKISSLGKERNIGFGFVKKAEVRETEQEWGLVKDGKAMRPIPVKLLKSYEDSAYLPYKPPYWSKDNIELCAVPFTKVELGD